MKKAKYSKFKTFITLWTTPKDLTREDGIRFWQDRLMLTLLFAGVVMGFLVYLPSLALSIKERLWSVAVADTLIYAWVVILFFRRSIPFVVRASTFIFISYPLGMVLLLTIGPFGAGPVWLFAFPVVAGLLMGLRASIVVLAVNAGTITLIGILLWLGHLEWGYDTINALEKWVVICLNFILLNSIVAISVAIFSGRIQALLVHEKSMLKSLEHKHTELIESNRQLKQEMTERKHAEEKKANLKENSSRHKRWRRLALWQEA